MPTICTYRGVTITLYYNDHLPPHFHARYAGHRAEIGIDPVVILAGGLPSPQLRWTLSWAQRRQQELKADWDLAQNSQPPQPIQP